MKAYFPIIITIMSFNLFFTAYRSIFPLRCFERIVAQHHMMTSQIQADRINNSLRARGATNTTWWWSTSSCDRFVIILFHAISARVITAELHKWATGLSCYKLPPRARNYDDHDKAMRLGVGQTEVIKLYFNQNIQYIDRSLGQSRYNPHHRHRSRLCQLS